MEMEMELVLVVHKPTWDLSQFGALGYYSAFKGKEVLTHATT